MPELTNVGIGSPLNKGKSLEIRKNRAQRSMVIMKSSDPALFAMRLRIGIRRSLNDANATTSPTVRAECLKSACSAIHTFMELIGHPKRPAATSAKGLKQVLDLELPADIVEQVESNPLDSEKQEAA